MRDNTPKTFIELVAINHDESPTSLAPNLYIGSHPDNLKKLGPFGTWMRLFHLDDIVKRII